MKTYKQLYNEHQEYISLRNRTGDGYEKYLNDVKYWKLKYLTLLLDRNEPLPINQVVEIGCATGELLNQFLNEKNFKKTGIDISDENIKYAQTFFENIDFKSIDYKDFFNNNKEKVDVVILSDILEHVEDDVEMLKISGENSQYVLLNMPIEKVPEYKDRIYGIDDIEGHLRAYSVKDTENLIEKAGLKVVDFEVRNYVLEPVFKNYLLKKIMKNSDSKADGLEKYLFEVLDIEMNINFYKKNYFGLLTKK